MDENFPYTQIKNSYQRRRDKLAEEGVFRKGQRPQEPIPAETPAEPKQEEVPAEKDALRKMFSQLSREEMQKLLDEYPGNTDIVEFAAPKIEPKQEAINQDALLQEYRTRLSQIPNGQVWAITALKQEMRQKGLRSIN